MLTLAEARDVLKATAIYRQVPRRYIEEQLGEETTDYQDKILGGLNQHKQTAVRSCHNSGKTWLGSRAVSWWLHTRPNGLVITTAPTFKQVENQIWREINGMNQTHKGVLSGTVLKTRWDISPTWYALGISPGDPTSMQGFHSKSGESR